MYLLDTNVLSEIRKGERCTAKVARWLEGTEDDELFTSTLVIAEIARGIAVVRRKDAVQADALERWMETICLAYGERILGVDLRVARVWGTMNAKRVFPVLDGLLASTALAHGFVLVTRNTRDIQGSGVRFLDPFVDRRIRRA